MACLEVQDTASVSTQKICRICSSVFTAAGRSGSQKSTATGLGLAIVKEIIDMHGGSVTIHSELGKGSNSRPGCPFTRDPE